MMSFNAKENTRNQSDTFRLQKISLYWKDKDCVFLS